jgi:hypothetical protein
MKWFIASESSTTSKGVKRKVALAYASSGREGGGGEAGDG